MTKALKDKIIESLTSILPIALIVLVLSVAFVPLEAGTFVLFLVGVFLLIVGLGCFMLGADMSMLVIGEKIGATMTHSRKIWLIALLSFIIGIIVTIAEPDLQILAEQVPAIAEKTPLGNYLLILTVAVGVGIFLTIGMLRIVFRIPLHYLLNRKMEAARELLASTRTPIKELAAMLGFSDQYHFAALFRRKSGLPPGRYRAVSANSGNGRPTGAGRRPPAPSA